MLMRRGLGARRLVWPLVALTLAELILLASGWIRGLDVDVVATADRRTLLAYRSAAPGLRIPEAVHTLAPGSFAVRWRGRIHLPQSGEYAFRLVGSGTGTLMVDGHPVVHLSSGSERTRVTGKRIFDGGDHDVWVEARPTRHLSFRVEVLPPGQRFFEPLPAAWMAPARSGWHRWMGRWSLYALPVLAIAWTAWAWSWRGRERVNLGGGVSRRRRFAFALLPWLLVLPLLEGAARTLERLHPEEHRTERDEIEASARRLVERLLGRRSRPAGTLEVLVFGASSVVGVPYAKGTAVDWLRAYVAAYGPAGPSRVVAVAEPGVGSVFVRAAVEASLGDRPDAILIYAGHNEFYESNRRALLDEPPLRSLVGLSAAVRLGLRALESCCPLAAAWLKGRPDPEREMAEVLDGYERQIRAAVAAAQRAGVEVALVAPASNLMYPPRGSIPPRGEPDGAIRAWRAALEAGRDALDGGETGRAVGQLSRAADLMPHHAETLYELGRALLAAGEVGRAKEVLAAARDWDGVIVRAPGEVTRRLEQIAREKGVVLRDAAKELARQAPRGLLDDALFSDFCHPNLRGYRLLGEIFYQALVDAGVLPPPREDRPGAQEILDRYARKVEAWRRHSRGGAP